jgi:hypothetical protein
VITLGGTVRNLGNKDGEPANFASKTSPFQTPREENPDANNGIQQKPINLARHKNSEFASYLMQHTKPAINTVARPF